MYSNGYIFRYASIMVILVAAILTTASLLLKPSQDRNVEVEKMQDILSSANIAATAKNAVEMYNERIIEEILVDTDGEIHSVYSGGQYTTGDKRAFAVDMKVLVKELEDFHAGKITEKPLLPIFHMRSDNGDEVFVIPVRGKGLWGPIWGNIAFASDFNTIVGVSLDHKGETPGLGAEINTSDFENQFIGKTIFDTDANFVSITVVKGGVASSTTVKPEHGVDAISGGTITSNGVSKMLDHSLRNYVPYIQKNKTTI